MTVPKTDREAAKLHKHMAYKGQRTRGEIPSKHFVVGTCFKSDCKNIDIKCNYCRRFDLYEQREE